MKRATAWFLCICLAFCLTACGGQQNTISGAPSQQRGRVSVDDSAQSNGVQAPSSFNSPGEERNILIAYFTWAENTQVENPDEIDVDASTSASVLLPGNAAQIANWIQQRTGGDLFSIVVTEPYSSDYEACLDRAADEKAERARPELVHHVENMEAYDTIFLGFPNWWFTVPMAVHSFLEEYDFSGKTVIPFVTHGTGGLSSTIQDITAALPNSTILDPIGVYRPEVEEAQPAVNAWLDDLGFSEASTTAAPTEDTASAQKTLHMVVDAQDIRITLNDTPAANALYDMLPLELTFEDYNHVEKISYLPEELSTAGTSGGCDPDVGDFCLYEPWGNLSIFYEDFRQSDDLIPLGQIESGIDTIANMDGDFTVTLEAAD